MEGSKVRTCDARCHDARGPRCDCWCGGRYHGCGGLEAVRRFTEDCGPLLKPDDKGRLAAALTGWPTTRRRRSGADPQLMFPGLEALHAALRRSGL